ncbi:MAG: hypothetical protein M5U31_13670 [Acidimicrobiia bacterium]|nr:hypothetical protein [Acidimicrobiia bacterium]
MKFTVDVLAHVYQKKPFQHELAPFQAAAAAPSDAEYALAMFAHLVTLLLAVGDPATPAAAAGDSAMGDALTASPTRSATIHAVVHLRGTDTPLDGVRILALTCLSIWSLLGW